MKWTHGIVEAMHLYLCKAQIETPTQILTLYRMLVSQPQPDRMQADGG